MKTGRTLSLCCLAIILLFAIPAGASQWFNVKWVTDGDTIVLEDGRRVRYLGINAPEKAYKDQPGEFFGNKAKDFNRRLVGGKKIRLAFDREKTDRFGRVLAYVYLPDGRMVNTVLIENGMAWLLPQKPPLRFESRLMTAQKQAMKGEKGLWKKVKTMRAVVIGNQNSRRFHATTCLFGKQTGAKNRVIFKTPHEAFFTGYAPCKQCFQFQ